VKFTDENFNCNTRKDISSNVLGSDGRPKAFIPKVNGLIRRWRGLLKAEVARGAAPFKVLQSALRMGSWAPALGAKSCSAAQRPQSSPIPQRGMHGPMRPTKPEWDKKISDPRLGNRNFDTNWSPYERNRGKPDDNVRRPSVPVPAYVPSACGERRPPTAECALGSGQNRLRFPRAFEAPLHRGRNARAKSSARGD